MECFGGKTKSNRYASRTAEDKVLDKGDSFAKATKPDSPTTVTAASSPATTTSSGNNPMLAPVNEACVACEDWMSTLPADAQALLAKLQDGNERYMGGNVKPKGSGERRRRLSECGQEPEFGILGCADSRVPPELVFDVDAGEVFNVRVAGNIITTEGAASFEYAVAHCKVKMLFVLGHTKCGAVLAAGSAGPFTGHLPALLSAIRPACKHSEPVKQNVLNQMKNLREMYFPAELYPALHICGGIFDITTGKVEFLPPV